MRRLMTERGYALFLTLMIIILFGVLAVSLLTIVVSGANRNAIREDVTQANELSEKALQHIINKINHELQESIPEKGISETDFKTLFESVLQNHSCTSSGSYPVTAQGKTGDYKACVNSWEDDPTNNLMKKVNIISSGLVEGKEQSYETTVLMGADGLPVPLKYVLSTNASKDCVENKLSCKNGEGNLFLHGGSTITGDMKIDGNIIVSDMAYTPARAEDYLIKEVYWVESILPTVNQSELELGGDVYRYHLPSYLKMHSIAQSKYREKIDAYDKHINLNEFTSSEYEKLSKLEDAFFKQSPKLAEKQYFQEDVKITENIEDFKYSHDDPGVIGINSAAFQLFEGHRTFKNINQTSPTYGFYCAEGLIYDCVFNIKKNYNGKFYLVGNNNNFHKFAVKQDLHIGRELTDVFNEGIKINIRDRQGEQGGLYVGRNLLIGRGLTSNLEAATKDPNIKVEIDGNIFVNGDLTISGADAKFNSIIYVNGDVTIDRSKFTGLSKNGKEGSLIVFANGKINFIKNNLFRNEPTTLRGFFYSKEGIEIFGSASNFKVEGGLSAPKIVLNSTRGRTEMGGLLGVIKPFTPSQHFVAGYYEMANNQADKPSRLQVEYDESILNTYSDLSIDDYIYNVVRPTILKREEK